MKMLVHRVATSANAPFEFDELKNYLRLDHSDDDVQIEGIGLTAAAEIEQFSQLALLTQTIRVTIFDPTRNECGLSLPVGPVADDATITITIDGEPFTDFDFSGGNRPYIRWLAGWHDLMPVRVSIEYEAGFGDTASDVPRDLSLAIMDQAALHYDGRSPMDAKALASSPHMARIAARYRGVSA